MAAQGDKNIQEEIENKIIDLIALGAGGRLIAFKPENSDKDLIVEKKGDYKKKAICLNIYQEKEIQQLAEKKELKAKDDFYLVFVNFDFVKQDIDDNFWLVPSSDFQKKLLTNKKDFVRFLIESFEKK